MLVKPKITEVEVLAVSAVIAGAASKDQQIIASDWLMREAARVPDMSMQFGPGGDRETAFAEGRRYVGALWRQMLLPVTLDRAKRDDTARLKRSREPYSTEEAKE